MLVPQLMWLYRQVLVSWLSVIPADVGHPANVHSYIDMFWSTSSQLHQLVVVPMLLTVPQVSEILTIFLPQLLFTASNCVYLAVSFSDYF
jgi:hypothetical protein